MITAQQLAEALGIPFARACLWLEALNAAMARFEIDTPRRSAAFLAQVAHESALLTTLEENLDYSASGLLAVFPQRFTPAEAAAYQPRPVAIANRVYASRHGNGDEASGDGWKYRGRGLIQVTFRDNYRACGAALGNPFELDPDALVQRGNAALSAAWYWKAHGCNQLADAGDTRAITLKINGGVNGLEHRTALYRRALPVLMKGGAT